MLNVIMLSVVKLNVVAPTKDPKAMFTALDVLCNLQIGPISQTVTLFNNWKACQGQVYWAHL